jgi:hypothetical protein
MYPGIMPCNKDGGPKSGRSFARKSSYSVIYEEFCDI